MILQSLYDYYQRLAADPQSGVARPGFSMEKIGFALVLNANGELVGNKVMDLRHPDVKHKLKPTLHAVPRAVKGRSGKKKLADFLWGNRAYVLGVDEKGKPTKSEHFAVFKELHQKVLGSCNDPLAHAILAFLDKWSPDSFMDLQLASDMLKTGSGNIMFHFQHVDMYAHEAESIKATWLKKYNSDISTRNAQCLISGKRDQPLAILHTQMSNIGDSTGSSLVGFNNKSFESFGKEQGGNAPTSEWAEFCYTTALNHLLAPGGRQKTTIADTTVVFWAKTKDRCESILADLLLSPPPLEEDDNSDDALYARKIHNVLLAARNGKQLRAELLSIADEPDLRIFILGLAPNAARLSVRFWETESLEKLVGRIGRHYADIEIVGKHDIVTPLNLLRQTAVQGKQSNIPPKLVGELMKSILTGGKYPLSFYSALLVRIRAERMVNQARAAMLKGILVRNFPNHNKEILTMSLNTETTDVAYRLGRLFAVLEGLQYSAVRPSATIKDRFFGSASSTPASVFPNLLRNAQNHISKIGWGDQPIQEILSTIDDFPPYLDMQQQGRFVIGYYHQRQDHFNKIAASKTNTTKEEA